MSGVLLGFLMLLSRANSCTNKTSSASEGAYCRVECLDKQAATDAVFFIFMSGMGVIFIPLFVYIMAFMQRHELQTKRLVQELALTPRSKRDMKLEGFCQKYKVEYMEVEDDGLEPAEKKKSV